MRTEKKEAEENRNKENGETRVKKSRKKTVPLLRLSSSYYASENSIVDRDNNIIWRERST